MITFDCISVVRFDNSKNVNFNIVIVHCKWKAGASSFLNDTIDSTFDIQPHNHLTTYLLNIVMTLF